MSASEANRRAQEAVDKALQQAESVFSLRVAELLKRERERRKASAKHAEKRGRDALALANDRLERLEEVRKAKLSARAAEMDGRIRAAEERAEARIRRISERVQVEAKRAREAVRRAKAAEERTGVLEDKLKKTTRDLDSAIDREKTTRSKYLALQGKGGKSGSADAGSPSSASDSGAASAKAAVEMESL